MPKKPEPPVVEIPEQPYQPSKVGLKEPIQVSAATFEEAQKGAGPARECASDSNGKSRKHK